MSNMITFIADGIPKGQPRPRSFVRGKSAAVYDPGTAEGWKGCVVLAGKRHRPRQPLAMPLMVSLTFWMPRPKGHYRRGKHAGELKLGVPHWHTGKPDADNLAKAVLDAMTQDGWWLDDSQVVSLMAAKRYIRQGERSGVHVRIEPMVEPREAA